MGNSAAIIRKIGTYAVFSDTFYLFLYGILRAFDIFGLLGAETADEIMWTIGYLWLFIGFSMLFLGSVADRKSGKIEPDPEKLKKAGLDPEFVKRQLEYTVPRGEGHGQTRKFFIILIILALINGVHYLLYSSGIKTGIFLLDIYIGSWRGFYIYVFALGTGAVAFLVALVAGNVTEDIMRAYFFGYHLHESMVGLFFICIGAPLIGTSPFISGRFMLGTAFISAGVFLIGRDWRDIVIGDLLVHKSQEKDLEQYMRLKKLAESENFDTEKDNRG